MSISAIIKMNSIKIITTTVKIAFLLFIFQFGLPSSLYANEYDELLRQFQSGSVIEKRLAIKSLKEFNDKSLFSLFKEASNHQDHYIRRHAIEGISRFKTPESFQILKKSLSDPSPFVIEHSIPLFKQFPFPESVDSLLPLLKRPMGRNHIELPLRGTSEKTSKENKLLQSNIIILTIEALTYLGDKDIVFQITDFLNYPDDKIQALAYLNTGVLLQKFKHNYIKPLDADLEIAVKEDSLATTNRLLELFLPSFIKTWSNADISVQKNAIWCLGIIADTFIEQLDAYILFEENAKLNRLGVNIRDRLTSIVPLLLASLEKLEDKELKWYLLTSLSKFRFQDSLPIFIKGLKDSFFLIRIASIKGILELDHDDSIPEILPLLNDPVRVVRLKAIEGLEQTGSSENTPQLVSLLDDKNAQMRWYASKALGAIGNEKAVLPLITRLKSIDGFTRSVTVQSLGRLGSEEAIESIIEVSDDESYLVREQAGLALGRLKSTEKSFVALIKLLSDKNKYVRRSAFNSLSNILKNPDNRKKHKKMIPMLSFVLRDEDTYIRANASKFIEKISLIK